MTDIPGRPLVLILALLAAPSMALLQGCINTEAGVRAHRGSGTKKISHSPIADINGAIETIYFPSLYTVTKEEGGVVAKNKILNEATGIYLTPQSDGTIEIEVLVKDDRFLSGEAAHRTKEIEALNQLMEIAAIKESGRVSIDRIKADAAAQAAAQERAAAEAQAAVKSAQDAAEKDRRDFDAALPAYRAAKVKPPLPETARKYKVQAEAAIQDKDFNGAAGLLRQALKIAPWWPEGRYNLALVLGETGGRAEAAVEMKRYLALVPDAPDAREAQDKIYVWER
jgi:tetratricopeptide (TPR) repeat protein